MSEHTHRTDKAFMLPFRGCIAGDARSHSGLSHKGGLNLLTCSCGAVQYMNGWLLWSETGPWHRPEDDADWPVGMDWMEWAGR